jgi:uncharacterized membrane protein YkvA (DUF1232 family)
MNKARKPPEGFENARRKAEEYANDTAKTEDILEAAESKAKNYKSALDLVWDDLQTLIRLVRTWKGGAYDQVPWKTIVFAIAGMIYFVNPFDVVPDFLPIAGYLDDAAVIGFVIKSIKDDIERFLAWESVNKTD